MPPFPRVPGLDGQEALEKEPPEGWDEEPPEGFEEDEGWVEDEEEPYPDILLTGLEDLAAIINHPEDYPKRENVCVFRVHFRDAPLMLERLREAAEPDIGISFVGNLDRLRRAGDLHAGLSGLSGSVESLHKKLSQDCIIEWAVVGVIEDAPTLLAPLCEMQPDDLRDSALPLLEGLRVMLLALPDKPATDAAAGPKYPSALVAALISRIGDLRQGIDELLLGGLVLEFPGAREATFLCLKESDQEEEQQQERHVVRIQGLQDLKSVIEEPNKYMLQDYFSVVQFQFSDARNMFQDLQNAAEKGGWWVGNMNRLQQASDLNASLCRTSRSLGYVLLCLKDNWVDWYELESIGETTPKLAPLCVLQPDDLRTSVLALITRIEALLGALPEKPDNPFDEPEYPPEVFARLIACLGNLPDDIDALGSMIIRYPDAEAPPPSPPPQPPVL